MTRWRALKLGCAGIIAIVALLSGLAIKVLIESQIEYGGDACRDLASPAAAGATAGDECADKQNVMTVRHGDRVLWSSEEGPASFSTILTAMRASVTGEDPGRDIPTGPGIQVAIATCPEWVNSGMTLDELTTACQGPTHSTLVLIEGETRTLYQASIDMANDTLTVWLEDVPAGEITLRVLNPVTFETGAAWCSDPTHPALPLTLDDNGVAAMTYTPGTTVTCSLFVMRVAAGATPGASPVSEHAVDSRN